MKQHKKGELKPVQTVLTEIPEFSWHLAPGSIPGIKRFAHLNKKIKIGSLNKFCHNESDDEDEGQGFQIVNEEDELELTDNLHPKSNNCCKTDAGQKMIFCRNILKNNLTKNFYY
jgi:hypothetical protein